MTKRNRNTPTYKRRQVTWAYWRIMSAPTSRGKKELHKKFEYRVKRLVDLDRMENEGTGRFAFYEQLPGGHGKDLLLSEFDAFCIGVALHLLDMGVRHTEVIRYFSMFRAKYHEQFSVLLQYLNKNDAFNENIVFGNDVNYFVAFQKSLISELHDLDEEITLPPIFFAGNDKLMKYFSGSFPADHKKALIIEIGHILVGLRKYLEQAPEFKRGR